MGEEYCEQIIVIPSRIPGEETIGELLEGLRMIDGIERIDFGGTNCDPMEIRVGDQSISLPLVMERLMIEIDDIEAVEEIRDLCDDIFQFPYSMSMKRIERPVAEKGLMREIGILR
jgi:methyl coenzyme M reductase subunit D